MIYRAVSKVTVRVGDRVKLNDEQAFNARHLVELPETTCRDDAGIDRDGVGTGNQFAILVYGAVS